MKHFIITTAVFMSWLNAAEVEASVHSSGPTSLTLNSMQATSSAKTILPKFTPVDTRPEGASGPKAFFDDKSLQDFYFKDDLLVPVGELQFTFLEWLERHNDNPYARFKKGLILHRDGKNTNNQLNLVRGVNCIRYAADNGVKHASLALGQIYASESQAAEGAEKRKEYFEKAANYLEKAAMAGLVKAKLNLLALYLGVEDGRHPHFCLRIIDEVLSEAEALEYHFEEVEGLLRQAVGKDLPGTRFKLISFYLNSKRPEKLRECKGLIDEVLESKALKDGLQNSMGVGKKAKKTFKATVKALKGTRKLLGKQLKNT